MQHHSTAAQKFLSVDSLANTSAAAAYTFAQLESTHTAKSNGEADINRGRAPSKSLASLSAFFLLATNATECTGTCAPRPFSWICYVMKHTTITQTCRRVNKSTSVGIYVIDEGPG